MSGHICDAPACDDFETSDESACEEGLHRIETDGGVWVSIDAKAAPTAVLPDGIGSETKIDAARAAELAEGLLQAASVLRWLSVGYAFAADNRLGCFTCRGTVSPNKYCGECGLTRQEW